MLVPLVWGLIRRTEGLPMFGAPTVAQLEALVQLLTEALVNRLEEGAEESSVEAGLPGEVLPEEG